MLSLHFSSVKSPFCWTSDKSPGCGAVPLALRGPSGSAQHVAGRWPWEVRCYQRYQNMKRQYQWISDILGINYPLVNHLGNIYIYIHMCACVLPTQLTQHQLIYSTYIYIYRIVNMNSTFELNIRNINILIYSNTNVVVSPKYG